MREAIGLLILVTFLALACGIMVEILMPNFPGMVKFLSNTAGVTIFIFVTFGISKLNRKMG